MLRRLQALISSQAQLYSAGRTVARWIFSDGIPAPRLRSSTPGACPRRPIMLSTEVHSGTLGRLQKEFIDHFIDREAFGTSCSSLTMASGGVMTPDAVPRVLLEATSATPFQTILSTSGASVHHI
jgi:hypothetical protein